MNPVVVTHDVWVSDDRSGFLESVRNDALIPVLPDEAPHT